MTRSPLWLAALLPALACATPYAKLDGILAGATPVRATDAGKVTVIASGEHHNGTLAQSVNKGDSLHTASDGVALLTLRAGYEVIVEPGSEINIESVFITVGKLIFKKLKEVSEKLRVNTKFVSAGAEGTEFVFEVARDQTVRITVLEGALRVSPRVGGWREFVLRGGQMVVINGAAVPGAITTADDATIRAFRDRRFAVERAAGYKAGEPWGRFKPLWQKPAFLVPAAVVAAGATAVVLATKGSGTRTGTVVVNIPF
jgi:hypothetical protein